MSKSHREPTAPSRAARRAVAGGLAFGLAAATLGLAAPASAAVTVTSERLGGVDRYATAVEVSRDTFAAGSVPNVVVASGANFPDALAASALAGDLNSPVLLVPANGAAPASVVAEIQRLGATRVTVVGGSGAVSATTVASLGVTNVDRVSGPTRYETAAAVANAIRTNGVGVAEFGTADLNTTDATGALRTVFLARGDLYADAVAASAPAAAGEHPVLLTAPGALPAATAQAIQAGGVQQVIILGGTGAVSADVAASVAAISGVQNVVRVSGADRYATAVALANVLISDTTTFNWDATAATIATGQNFPDALAAGPRAAREQAPILFAGLTVPAATQQFLQANDDTMAELTIVGGSGVIPDAVVQALITAATFAPGNLGVMPTDTVTLTLANDEAEGAANDASDNRSYTVSGLQANTGYSIALVDSANMQQVGGQWQFRAGEGNLAVLGSDAAYITSVNNVAMEADVVNDLLAVSGNITFTIEGAAPGSVTPVVFLTGAAGRTPQQGGTNVGLELGTPATGSAFAAPIETFGVGGTTVYTAPAAAAGDFDGVVDEVNKASDFFVLGEGAAALRYNYDANDRYYLWNGTQFLPTTMSTFESQLSSGDEVGGTYTTDPAAPSELFLVDTNPVAPATTASFTNNRVEVEVAATGDFDSVVIQRAPVTGDTVGTFSTIATATADAVAGGAFTYIDAGAAPGTYQYRAALVNDGDQSDFGTPSANVVVTQVVNDTTPPTAVDTRVTVNTNGSALLLNPGDQFRVVFSEEIAPIANNATMRLQDADGTVWDVVRGGVGDVTTFQMGTEAVTIGTTTYPANQVLLVTIPASPTEIVAGSEAGLGIPSTIIRAAGFADVAGNQVSLTGDVIVDNE